MLKQSTLRSVGFISLLISGLLLSCGRNLPTEPLSGQQATAVGTADTTATTVAIATQAELNEIASVVAFKDQMAVQQTQEMWDLATVEAGGVLPTPSIISTLSPRRSAFATKMALGYSPTPEPLPQAGLKTQCPLSRFTRLGNCWNLHNPTATANYFLLAGADLENNEHGFILVQPMGSELTIAQQRVEEYTTPSNIGGIMIESATWPLVYITTQTTPTQSLIFNLETRQWLDPNGTPMPMTATPTSTSEPTVATPTPAGGIAVTSLTLFNADTDQAIIGFDPMDTPTILDFVALGTRRLNIRANTSPATVGSVRFSLDGAPYRIEGGAPYALQGNTGSDYAAWTPSAGQHQLVVTAFSGANATGTQGGSFTLDFTVVDTATATVAPATATATGIPASITPVPATPTSTGSTSTPSAAKTALFVVGDASALNANDTAIQSLLVGEGYTVSLKSAAQSSSADATGKQLVLISSSVSAGNVGSKFTSVAVPVIVWEHALYDDLGMTGPTTTTDYGTASGNTLVISNATHGLAGGLSGTVTVYTGSGSMAYGVPASSAINIAPQGSSNSKKVYFGYEQGVTMIGSVIAPARRVGLFLSDSGTLSSDGQTLVKAAFAWATGQ
ncbi:hypothetical protein [Herpetosiphon gulosus]|uniref:Uncharacterized protein n=1 Tax=Herpetosiphon gulosus TaxID=1973496 RepID=A0ABP9WVN3_9CHLR